MSHPEETKAVVNAILEQIPDLAKVTHVRRRDGEIVPFDAKRVGLAFTTAFREVGINDEQLLARCTHQALMRLDREFDGHAVPTTDDVDRIVTVTLIDNNLPFAAKKYLQATAQTPPKPAQRPGPGLRVSRRFTRRGVHPFDTIVWEVRDAVIADSKGKPVFEQRGIEVPTGWSQQATNIVASKYFRGQLGQPDRETSVRQMISRVVQTISDWGRQDGYFASEDDVTTFGDELTHILVNQQAAFNSPVWFNVGVNPHPQCSACFINSVRDDMRSILNLAVTEGMLFKYGSGTGSNLSALRSSQEHLSKSSGKSSGPVSFMRGFDAFAGIIKSGGKTRRAAKMVILNADHPDIEEFVDCKAREERKARDLMKLGYDGSIDGEAYSSIFFQNANNSVRADDDFLRAVIEGRDWQTRAVTTGAVVGTMPARKLMRQIAQAAWECGDPGMQYDTTVNRWHTCPNSGRINASNPCSEYMFLDDTACNLASLNLMKFRRPDGEFDIEAFSHAVEVVTTAMEILVENSSYPTPAIEQNSFDFHPLGLGYANLGALLMSRGLAYDSEEGRHFAASLTSLMSGRAYAQSAKVAAAMGPFRGYRLNERPFLHVIGMHRDHAYAVPASGVPAELSEAQRRAWDAALEQGMASGYRNSQISVLAPTGTIGFLMDCDTTGIEPDIALVKYKWLVGGGLMKIVNQTVPEALRRLGYDETATKEILAHLDKNETIEGAPGLKPEHLPVFDCAFKPAKGQRTIHYMGHIRMMSAVQPFLSGAISKTVNMPHEATPQDIENAYLEAWKMGIKAIAIYRDGSKGQQVLTTSSKSAESKPAAMPATATAAAPAPATTVAAPTPAMADTAAPAPAVKIEYRPLRRRLPDERRSVTHKFRIAGHKGYLTVGLYDDGSPGEIFVTMSKGGSVISGLMDALASSVSIAMQYGVPLKVFVNKFVHVRFEPSGFTTNPNIRIAKSIIDYIFRWLALKFLATDEQRAVGVNADVETLGEAGQSEVAAAMSAKAAAADAAAAMAKAEVDEDDDEAMEPQDQLPLEEASFRAKTSNALTMGFDNQADAPACGTCGAMMVRNGACYKCLNCGSTSGCS